MVILENLSIRRKTLMKSLKAGQLAYQKAQSIGLDSESYTIRNINNKDKHSVIYNISSDDNHSKFYFHQLKITEIRLHDLDQTMDQINTLMKFAIGGQQYKGWANYKRTNDMFLTLFEYWVQNQKQTYSMFVVQEKPEKTLKEYIRYLKTSDGQEEQEEQIYYLCERFRYDTEDICIQNKGDLKCFYDFTLDNIFTKGDLDGWTIPAYTFKTENLVQAGNLDEDVLKQFGYKHVQSQIFSQLYEFAKAEKFAPLVKELEGMGFEDEYFNIIYPQELKYKDPSIKQERINKQLYYKKGKLLGKGAFGEVFEVSVENQKKLFALKKINSDKLKELSKIIIESQLNMYFVKGQAPLIDCQDIFLEYNEDNFVLCLVMDKAGKDLKEIIKETNEPFPFMKLHQVTKSIGIAIGYMHTQNLSHLDIKPENFLKLKESYKLSDFGTGIDLHYEEKNEKKIFFQVKYWSWSGTPKYCDPILRKEFNKHFIDQEFNDVFLDPFKADIYSAGLTIYEAATGKSVNGMNNPDFDQRKCFKELDKLALPRQLKTIICQMIQYEASDRISVHALFLSLKYFMERITNSTSLQVLRSLDEKQQLFFKSFIIFEHDKHDWFMNDFQYMCDNKPLLFQKIKQQTTQDLSYFCGEQRLDCYERNRNQQILNKIPIGQIISLKPNYMLAYYLKKVSNEESLISIHEKLTIVKNKDIQTVQFQYFKENQYLEFYDVSQNSWLPCKLLSAQNDVYSIKIKSTNEVLDLPKTTNLLRRCLCFKCTNSNDFKNEYGYQKIQKLEKQLLESDRMNQLFAICDVKLVEIFFYETKIIDPRKVSKNFGKNNMLQGTLNIHFQRGQQQKLDQLLAKEFTHMVKCQKVKLNDLHLKAYQSRTLKMLRLRCCAISPSQLPRLFKALSFTKLQRFYLVNTGSDSINFETQPTQESLQELKTSFASFATNQQELYNLWMKIELKGNVGNAFDIVKQFKEVYILINKCGYRVQKSQFRFEIITKEEIMKEEMIQLTKEIREMMSDYYQNWGCKYNYYTDSLVIQHCDT